MVRAAAARASRQARPFGSLFLPWLGLCLIAAGLLTAPGLLGRLFSTHGQFNEPVVLALQTLRWLLLGTGAFVALGAVLLDRFTPALYRRLNGWVINAVLFLAALAISMGLAEGVLRWVDPWGVSQLRYAHQYFSRAVIPSPEPEIGYVHKPSYAGNLTGVGVEINRRGLRDRDVTYERPPSVFRILCLGDSVTFGWGIPTEETFPKQLEGLLNRDGSDRAFEVINAGVGGYNAVQEAAFYRAEASRYETDLVLLFYTINDASVPLDVLQETQVDPHERWANLRSFCAGIFKRVFATLFGLGRYMTLPRIDYLADYRSGSDEGWQAARAAIRSIHDLAGQRGSPFAVFMVPAMQDLDPLAYPYHPIHEMLGDLCREQGIPFFDLLPDFLGRENSEVRISRFDGHPNRFAHRLIARAVLDRLGQAGLLPPGEGARTTNLNPGRQEGSGYRIEPGTPCLRSHPAVPGLLQVADGRCRSPRARPPTHKERTRRGTPAGSFSVDPMQGAGP